MLHGEPKEFEGRKGRIALFFLGLLLFFNFFFLLTAQDHFWELIDHLVKQFPL